MAYANRGYFYLDLTKLDLTTQIMFDQQKQIETLEKNNKKLYNQSIRAEKKVLRLEGELRLANADLKAERMRLSETAAQKELAELKTQVRALRKLIGTN